MHILRPLRVGGAFYYVPALPKPGLSTGEWGTLTSEVRRR